MKKEDLLKIFFVLAVAILSSCQKENTSTTGTTPPPGATTMSGLKIDPKFDFTNTADIAVSIQIETTESRPTPHLIRIYNANPGQGGTLISTGMTSPELGYTSVLRLPKALNSVWVENVVSGGIHTYKEVAVLNNSVQYIFGLPSPVRKSVVVGDPGCINGVTRTISTTPGSIEIKAGEDVSLQAPYIGGITFSGNGTLRICAAATLTYININGGAQATIYVSASGNLIAQSLNLNNLNIYNYGTAQISGGLNVNNGSRFENHKSAQIVSFNNNQGTIFNDGTMDVSGSSNNNGTIINQNLMRLSGDFNNNGSATIDNECRMEVSGRFYQNHNLTNNGYFLVNGEVAFNGGSTTTMGGNALFSVTNNNGAIGKATFNGDIVGPITGCAKLSINHTTIINGGAHFINQLDLCDADGTIEQLNITLPSTVTRCAYFVPASSCSPSDGTPPQTVKDADGDGVPDDLDEYPNDPDRAFTSYYPNKTDYASIAFEDLWPFKGDYDFNDFVADYQYKIVSDAQNNIVDIIATYKVRAAGATQNNSFALALPVPSSSIKSITGYQKLGHNFTMNPKGYEEGHLNNTVIIVVDEVNTYFGDALMNTGSIIPYKDMAPFTVTINFATHIPSSQLIPPYNPFLIANQERGREIHLIDHKPTEKASLNLFGTGNDGSKPETGSYYKSATYLPWAIEIPVSFDYAYERKEITLAHLKFADWAQSSGTTYKDWYLDKPGYRDATFIYKKP
ncbi:MAG: LruC domain-containing protein [Bacteroidetes bacterium]|nr:LruC domain-containing protein [Bacteroidota bacterium]